MGTAFGETDTMKLQTDSTHSHTRIAIIGAGPAGLYAADAYRKQCDSPVQIDIFDKLPAPYGLVRYGVAPDHQKIKSVTKLYDRILGSPEVRFFGNVNFGVDITRSDLLAHYDQILYAVGAQADRQLGIPGEDHKASISATEFVAWFNGHPEFRDLDVDLSGDYAVVVGAGNVALDVARILARSENELRQTDIADYALEKLAKSNIRQIYILSRRGPVQAKFTPVELKELADLEEADVIVEPEALDLDAASAKAAEDDKTVQRNLEVLGMFAANPVRTKPKAIHFRFLTSPIEIVGQSEDIEIVRIRTNRLEAGEDGYIQAVDTGVTGAIPADLVLRSVGYRGTPLPDVPFDDRRGTIPNEQGRIIDQDSGDPVPNEYVSGWIKRGPSGVIGTNKPDAVETVKQMIADLPEALLGERSASEDITSLLAARNVQVVTYEDWQKINEAEIQFGEEQGRPRVKVTSMEEVAQLLERRVAA